MSSSATDLANSELRMAAVEGHPQLIRKLLAQGGADPLAKTADGSTALMLAAENRRAEAVRLLLAAAGEADNGGQTAFMRARSVPCLELLLPFSDMAARCALGRDALMHAAARGDADCVRWLVGRCDPLATDEMGFDALWLAVDDGRGSMECVQAVLPASDAQRLNRHGESLALRLALRKNEALLRLLAPRLDMSVLDQTGRCAFDWAVELGLWENAGILAQGSPPSRLLNALDFTPPSLHGILRSAIEAAEIQSALPGAPVSRRAPRSI